MRSKTEWVIGEGKNGKAAAEKLGLAPEQGKGIEYEFDLLIECNQRHFATITKDRTGRFQDETIEKPGEDFGATLHEWLSGGSSAPAKPAAKTPAKPAKAETSPAKPKAGKPTGSPTWKPSLKERGDRVIGEIGEIFNAAKNGAEYFSEDEKEEARKIIRETSLNEQGLSDLEELKAILSDELSKRGAGKAA